MITLPTLSELNTAYIADIESKYSITIPVIGRSFLRVWAGVQAGVAYLIYLALGKVQKNIFVDTCDVPTLNRFGLVKLGRASFPATAGEYTIEVTGTIGATIPASTVFKSDDDATSPSKNFILDVAYVLVAETDTINVRALEPGLDSQLSIGNTLEATAPISLVNRPATVTVETIAPISAETTEDYRRKILDAFRLEPQGGAGADYRLWSNDVSGVEQAYPYAAMGFTEVNLYIEASGGGTDGKGTPSAGTLADVEDSIEDPTVDRPSRKPILDVVNYLAITPVDVIIEITDFIGIDAAKEAAILSEITSYLSSVRPYVSSIDVLADKNDVFGKSQVIFIILTLYPGSVFGAIKITYDAVELPTKTFEGGNIPYLDSISYV